MVLSQTSLEYDILFFELCFLLVLVSHFLVYIKLSGQDFVNIDNVKNKIKLIGIITIDLTRTIEIRKLKLSFLF